MKNNELIVPSVSIQGSAQLIPFKTHRPWNIIKKALRGKSPVFVEQNPFISYRKHPPSSTWLPLIIFSKISHKIPWKNLKLDKTFRNFYLDKFKSFHSLQIM